MYITPAWKAGEHAHGRWRAALVRALRLGLLSVLVSGGCSVRHPMQLRVDAANESEALIRAERAGGGNGRVYQVHFTATDALGQTCTGAVVVGVPHSMNPAETPIDDGQLYDSTAP